MPKCATGESRRLLARAARALGRHLFRALIVSSFLVSGTIVILKLRTLDGRSNRLDGTTDAGTHWRIISSRDGMMLAWLFPGPRDGVVQWPEGGDGSFSLVPAWNPDDGRGHYWMHTTRPARAWPAGGLMVYRGLDYVFPGPVSRATWGRIHMTHGVAAATTFLPFAFGAAAAVMRWARSRNRRRGGACLRCGYDLRATPDRCPECGAVRAVAE
jgi:hypothetical protein